MSGSLDQELNGVTMTPDTSTSTLAASSVSPSSPAAPLSISLDLLHVVSSLLFVSFLCLPSFLYTVFHLVELLTANMDQCNKTFLFFPSLTFCVFVVFLNRQPPCSTGKVSFTPQRKSPSSMITRAYHKTLDKCQRGLRGGDLEDI